MRPLAAALLAAGVLHWVLFIGVPPTLPKEQADWPKEFRYYAVLKEAVTEGRIPYFITQPIQDTRKLFAIPEFVLSPQIVLLRWLSVDAFFLAHVLLLYAVGLAGCLALKRRYALSLPSFLLLWLLLCFGGHITSHLAIGHSMWGGYFLLPWFFLFVLQMVDSPDAGRSPVGLGIVLFVMLLQGSFHPFVWCVLFLVLLFVFGTAPRRLVLEALAWSAALNLFRLVPAAVILLGRREASFQTGFPALTDLLAGLVLVRDVTFPRIGSGSMGGLNWWEFDHYVGPIGFVWILAFGVFTALVRSPGPRRRLAGPILLMIVLTLGRLYAPLVSWHVPLLAAERVTSRLFMIPLGMLIVLAALASDEWSRRGPRARAVVLGLAVAATAASLAWHSQAWSIPEVARLLPPPPHARDLEIHIADPTGEGKDALYVLSVNVSALLSVGATGAAAWRLRGQGKGPQKS